MIWGIFMKNLFKSFTLLWKVNKFLLCITILFNIIFGLIPPIKLIITNELVNSVNNIIGGEQEYNNAIRLILLQFVVSSVPFILMHIQGLIKTKMEYRLNHHIEKNINLKMDKLPYELFEYPDFYNRFNRVLKNGSVSAKIIAPINSLLTAFSAAISLSSIILLLFQLHWLLVVLGFVAFIPFVFIHSRFGKQDFSLIKTQTLEQRKASYYKSLIQDKSSIREMRLFNLTKHFTDKWENLFLKNMEESITLKTKQTRLNIMLDLLKVGIYGVSSILIINLILNGRAKIGDFVMGVQAIEQIQSQTSVIAIEVSNIYSNLLYISDYYNLLDQFDRSESNIDTTSNKLKELQSIESIEFINAYFSYPNNASIVLENINIKITKGQKIALVGENGSGKTTLILCLLGLYKLTEGEIRINGKNINIYSIDSIRKRFTVIFQNFIRYALTIKENIELGDIKKGGNHLAFYNATEKSGVSQFAEVLQNSYDTQLGKLFEKGTDLSGGQWQKLAIARSIFRDSDVLILDEPTSALDPKSEYNVYKEFEKLSSNKISINISHRLAYVKDVDLIYVLKDGKVIEMGSHRELIRKGGDYYEMYITQSKAVLDDYTYKELKING